MGDIGATFTKKLGPLPAWAWIGVGAGVGLLWLRMRRKASVGGTPGASDLRYGSAPGGGILGTGNGTGGFVDNSGGSSGNQLLPAVDMSSGRPLPVGTPPGTWMQTVFANGLSQLQYVTDEARAGLTAGRWKLIGGTWYQLGTPQNPAVLPGTENDPWYTTVFANGARSRSSFSPAAFAQAIAQGWKLIGDTFYEPGTAENPGTGSATHSSVAGNLTPTANGPLVGRR